MSFFISTNMKQGIRKCLLTWSEITLGSSSSKSSKGPAELVGVQPDKAQLTFHHFKQFLSMSLQLQLSSPTSSMGKKKHSLPGKP